LGKEGFGKKKKGKGKLKTGQNNTGEFQRKPNVPNQKRKLNRCPRNYQEKKLKREKETRYFVEGGKRHFGA